MTATGEMTNQMRTGETIENASMDTDRLVSSFTVRKRVCKLNTFICEWLKPEGRRIHAFWVGRLQKCENRTPVNRKNIMLLSNSPSQ